MYVTARQFLKIYQTELRQAHMPILSAMGSQPDCSTSGRVAAIALSFQKMVNRNRRLLQIFALD
jgi:hypothetical protein